MAHSVRAARHYANPPDEKQPCRPLPNREERGRALMRNSLEKTDCHPESTPKAWRTKNLLSQQRRGPLFPRKPDCHVAPLLATTTEGRCPGLWTSTGGFARVSTVHPADARERVPPATIERWNPRCVCRGDPAGRPYDTVREGRVPPRPAVLRVSRRSILRTCGSASLPQKSTNTPNVWRAQACLRFGLSQRARTSGEKETPPCRGRL